MAGKDDSSANDPLRAALRNAAGPPDQAHTMRLMHLAIDVAEDLDALERKLDPTGPPPRHAAMAYQRLRRLKLANTPSEKG